MTFRYEIMGDDSATYFCKCGRKIVVPVSEMRTECHDYCGCGRLATKIASQEAIAKWRAEAGLLPLS